MKQEELCLKYQQDIKNIEDMKEEVDRKWKAFEEDQSRSRAEYIEDRKQVEELLNMWGDCEASGIVINEFEDTVEEEEQELRKREEGLIEERNCIKKQKAICEEQYDEEKRKSMEEEP